MGSIPTVTPNMRALLDGDIYAFRPAAASENDDLGIAISRMEEMIDNTLAETSADELSIFLSGPKENNFRYQVYPEYKANRPEERPRHLQPLKQYLIDTYGATIATEGEADDSLGIEQYKDWQRQFYKTGGNVGCNFPRTIICSIDKDLRMIPGNHYSFEIRGTTKGTSWVRPAEMLEVSEHAGLLHFYTQILVGDPADNIKGAPGIGKVKAARILAGCETELEMYEAIQPYFSCEEEILMTGQCLWIFRKPNDRWRIPTEAAISKGEGSDLPTEGA